VRGARRPARRRWRGFAGRGRLRGSDLSSEASWAARRVPRVHTDEQREREGQAVGIQRARGPTSPPCHHVSRGPRAAAPVTQAPQPRSAAAGSHSQDTGHIPRPTATTTDATTRAGKATKPPDDVGCQEAPRGFWEGSTDTATSLRLVELHAPEASTAPEAQAVEAMLRLHETF